MTYTLDTEPLGQLDKDGEGQYALRNRDYGEVICYQWFSPEDALFWSKLLNAQAEAAWEEGAEAYATRRARDESLPLTNPYTALENNK